MNKNMKSKEKEKRKKYKNGEDVIEGMEKEKGEHREQI